jgi:hypothetical protein
VDVNEHVFESLPVTSDAVSLQAAQEAVKCTQSSATKTKEQPLTEGLSYLYSRLTVEHVLSRLQAEDGLALQPVESHNIYYRKNLELKESFEKLKGVKRGLRLYIFRYKRLVPKRKVPLQVMSTTPTRRVPI